MSKFHRSNERAFEAAQRAQAQRLLRQRTNEQLKSLGRELAARVDLAAIEAELEAERYAGAARKA